MIDSGDVGGELVEVDLIDFGVRGEYYHLVTGVGKEVLYDVVSMGAVEPCEGGIDDEGQRSS